MSPAKNIFANRGDKGDKNPFWYSITQNNLIKVMVYIV